MSDTPVETKTQDLVLEYELDAPPEKVWRAISIPAFRERWLPEQELVSAEPVSAAPGEQISYRMRDDEPPFRESLVTFQVEPNASGGTRLKIIHDALSTRAQQTPPAANDNWRCLMRAA